MKVLVIGLGVVGFPTAEYFGRFFDVYGYDTTFRCGKNFTTVRTFNRVEPDIFVICVPTNQVRNICKDIDRNKLVLIESTMQIGTCKKIAEDFGIKLLAHCPHRYWELSSTLHGVKQLRVLGALNNESLKLAKQVYAKTGISVHSVSSLEVAEASKLVENANRFVNIAFSEEIKMLCGKLELDFEEVKRACNTKWNINLLEARDGIGGVCLPQDIRFLLKLYEKLCCKEGLMKGAVKTNEKYRVK